MLNWIFLASMLVAQTSDFKLVADARQLMDAIIIPASDVLFNVAFDPPSDEEAWVEVEHDAIRLAESGNLLLLRAEGREPWIAAANALIDAGEASLEAAQGRNPEPFLDLSDVILETCSNCHDVYLE